MTDSFKALRRLNDNEQKTDLLKNANSKPPKKVNSKALQVLRYICIVPGSLLFFGFCYWALSVVSYYVGYYGADLPIAFVNQNRILGILITPFIALFSIVPVFIAPGKKKAISWILTIPVVLYCLFYLIFNIAAPFLPYQVFVGGKPTLAESAYTIISYASAIVFILQGHGWNLMHNKRDDEEEDVAASICLLPGVFSFTVLELPIFISTIYICFVSWGWLAAGLAFFFPGISTLIVMLLLFAKQGLDSLVLINWLSLIYVRCALFIFIMIGSFLMNASDVAPEKKQV